LEEQTVIEMLASQNWGLFVLRGVFAIILGILAFVTPGPTLAALVLLFAAYAFVDGLFAIGGGLGAPNGPRWWLVVGGILGVGIGIYTFLNPQITAIALVIVIGAFAIVRGVAEVVTAIQLRNEISNEWLYVLSGVVSVIFGAFILASPGDGVLAVLWLIGYYALFAGIMYIVVGLRLRSVAKTLSSGTNQAAAQS
jgi:uncharacterized membrane protein HdeD (DUF308 family)